MKKHTSAPYLNDLFKEGIKAMGNVRGDIDGTEKIIGSTLGGLGEIMKEKQEILKELEKIKDSIPDEVFERFEKIDKEIKNISGRNKTFLVGLKYTKNYLKKGMGLIFNFWKKVTIDRLTGLKNKEYIDNIIDKLWAEKKTFYCTFVDINDLKYINDNYGHEKGNELMIWFAGLLKKVFNGKDFYISRIHGDEFLIIYLAEERDDDFMEKKIRELEKSALIENFYGENRSHKVKFGIGYSFSEDHITIGEMISTADARMYENKRKKKLDDKL